MPGGLSKSRQTRGDMTTQMHAKHTSPALCQHLEISARLRRLNDTEGVFFAGNFEIVFVVTEFDTTNSDIFNQEP